MNPAQPSQRKRISLQRVLISWSVLALGIAALLLSYFLYQASAQQFRSTWANKLEAELGGLRLTLQHQLAEEEFSLSDQTLSRMATRPHVSHLLLLVDGQVLLSTRRAEIDRPLGIDLASKHLSTDRQPFQFFQDGGHFLWSAAHSVPHPRVAGRAAGLAVRPLRCQPAASADAA
ncbi:MAG: hypothetical protein LRY66_05155 [Saccharospirillaceae bacterium]|nr:hypothetical protein [Saccharospirillaceae bacterium]